MSFLRSYKIRDWHGKEHSLAAKQLYERILKDSNKSYYGWIAPARELVRICKKSDFPAKYALTIKIAILDCFANIEHGANCSGVRYREDPADEDAVQYCYNSLYDVNTEEAISARNYYLTEMIHTASYLRLLDPLYHPGSTYRKFREDWIKSKFEEYISQEKIDFKQLVKTLHSNFTEVIKTAEANGDFEEDDRKYKEGNMGIFDKIGILDI